MSNHKTITDYISEKTNPYNASGLSLPPPPPQTPVATLRDQFAMAALTGILSNPSTQEITGKTIKNAWHVADFMMEARK
jgi:hypothetical protein